MHNTESAVANLINRYKAVLKKCHLLNTFGSLALATSLVCGGAGIACAATDSAYTLEGDIVDVYTKFTDYSVITSTDTPSKYVLDETQYGIKLKNFDYNSTAATSNTVQLLIENYLTTQRPTIVSSAYTIIESPTTAATGIGVGNITIDTQSISYAIKDNGAQLSNIGSRNIIITTGDYAGNYIGIVNDDDVDKNITGAGPWKSFNGGAVSVAIQENKSLSGISITGDFIDNSIKDLTSYTVAGQDTSKNSVFKNNGGAIGLFTNVSGASIEVATIKGDFIGNEAHRVGGAIYLFTNNNSITKVETITGNFIDNLAGSGGGAIANYEGEIVKIDGTFIGNVATAGGGAAIDNMMWSKVGSHKAKIGDIDGTFIGNSTGSTTIKGDGGAIRNFAYSYSSTTESNGYASIGKITADFIGNEATGDGGALYNYAHSKDTVASVVGGEVSNTASIVSVSGDFIGNIAGGSGGAIYNDDNFNSTASIGKITGDFINNTSSILGGAIYNTSVIGKVVSQKIENGNITGDILTGSEAPISITGNFINNTINGASNGIAIGGAIYNNANDGTASIGKIQGDFIGNIADAKLGLGGAIANYAGAVGTKATIGDIEGDFIGNTSTRYGGAIYNDSFELNSATIGNLTGDFINNSVKEDSGASVSDATAKAQGGAIYNNDTIGTISGSFIGNSASSTSTNVDINGGAIYTTANMNFKADGKTQYFSDNYTKDNTGTVYYNAIYVDIDNIISGQTNNIELNFNMSGTGNVVMNDSISGNTEYTPLTNTDYDTKKNSTDTATFTTSPSGTNTIVTIGYSGANRPTDSAVVTGAKETISEVTTTKVESTDANSITTTTTTVATTSYTGGTGTTTYASTIIVTDAADNIISVDTSNIDEVALTGITSTPTTTTMSTVKDSTGTATYTETDGTVTSAKIEKKEGDGTITTTTYTYNSSTDKTVLVSDADVTKNMTGTTAYNINITGGSKANTFYLRDEVTQFGDFKIDNATLHLGAYTHTDGTKTVGKLIAIDEDSSVTFGANSQLTIDMSAYEDCMTSGSSISENAVLTGHSSTAPSKGANIIIDSTSKLRLENVHSGSTFTILKGFDAEDSTTVTIQEVAANKYAAWTIDNVSVDSDLLAITILRDGYNDTKDHVVDDATGVTGSDDVYYVISIVKSDDSPLFDTSVGNIVSSAAEDTLFGSDSAAAGDRYYYDISTIPDEHDEKTAAEGTANMAKVSGVPTTTFRVNRLSSDALSSRGDFGGGAEAGSAGGVAELSKKNESTALWALPMYGHDVTDGASVAGYGADYHTNIYGGVVGIDKTIDSANALGADQYRVGVALNMGGGDTKSSGHFSNVNSDFNFGGAFVYGIAKYGDFTLRADAGFNKIFSEMSQDLSKHGIAGTEADVQSHAWSVDLSGEYRIATDVVDITPYVGLELVSMKTEDYAVKRSDAAGGTLYNIESDRQNIVSVPVGVKLDAEWAMEDSWTLTPQLSVGAIFAMGDLDEHSSIRMPDVAGSGQTSIQVVDEVTLDMAVGVSIANDVWTIGLDYELQKSEHRTGHGLTGLVQYKF